MRFNELAQNHKLKFIWVRGHADNPYNNRCDMLATTAAAGDNLISDQGYENEKNNLFSDK